MIGISTTDLCDANEEKLASGALRVLTPGWLVLGRRRAFAGPAQTLRLPDDNSLVRSALSSQGGGSVLVIDAGARRNCAFVGGQLAQLAAKNGWAGIIVNGCVRDVVELEQCDIGVRALALHPRRSAKNGAGERDVTVEMAGALIGPGAWIYSDADGILISLERLDA